MPKFLNPITITTPSGSAPLIVNSSTLVTNLNADLLDGQHGSFYQNAGNLNAGTLQAARLPAFSGGDVTSTAGTVALTLANSGVTAGTYTKVTVDAKGRVTTGALLASADLPTYTGTITSGQVTTALGFTPYNATNPSGYITSTASITGYSGGISVSDSRAVVTTPQSINMGVVFDFKQNTTDGLSDGGTYFGEMTFRQYGSTTDWSGGLSHQLGFTDNGNIWQRSGSNTTWGAWKKLLDTSNFSSHALPLSGGTLTGQLFSNSKIETSSTVTGSIFYGAGTGLTGTAPSLTAGAVPWTGVTGKPTTLAGYGITDALPLTGGTLTGALNGTTASFSGNVKGGRVTLRDDCLEQHVDDSDSVGVFVNYFGFASGTTRFRNFGVFNGKNQQLFYITGSTGAAQLNGQLSVNGTTASDILRLYTTGSTIWKLGVTDASGSLFNITADFGNFTINKTNGNVTTPGAFVGANFSGPGTGLTGTAAGLSIGGSAVQLNGQAASFYQNAGNLNAGTLLAARMPAFTGGDVTSTAGTVALTLANSGVTAGTYRSVTTDAKGRVTGGTNPTTLAGYGITDALDTSGAAQTKSGNLTVNSALTSGGAFYAATTVQYSNRQPIYTIYYGGGQDLAWKKVADITIGTGLYRGVTFKVDVVDNQGNFGFNSNCFTLTYFATCIRSGGIQDDFNNAVVTGPVADYVRVVKTATGVYELQIRQLADWQTYVFTVEATINSGGNTVTYASSTPPNGSTTGTIYTATPGWTSKLANIAVAGGGSFGGAGSFGGQITSTVATGTAPFVINSTTQVNNLNAQLLGGQLSTYYAAASSLTNYLPKSGGAMTGALALHSTGTNGFYNGTGDGATYALYNFKLGGWNGMALENLAPGGTYPSQVVGVIDFRGGTIDMKGGFKVNGASVITENQSITISGDASGTGKTAINLTLASVGTAGTYRSVTTDAKGRVTAGTNPTTLAGYGITDALPLTGGTLTGAITINGVSDAVVVQTNGNAAQWYGRISVRNSTSDKSSFLGTYQGVAGVFAHNNALNAWADLYVNTVDGTGGGIVRMSSDVRIGGNAALHAASTSAPNLSVGGSSARWATGRTISLTGDVSGTSAAFDGTAALSFATTLANSGVGAGTYRSVTVNAKGLVTAGTNPTTISGYGITDAMYQVDPNGFTQGDINGSGNMQRLWGTDSVQNLIAFRPPTTVEYTTDNVNWVATTISNDVFDGKVFGKWAGFNMNVGSNIGAWTKVRMTWVNFGYHFFSHFTLCHSTNGHSMNFVFYKSDLSGVFSSEAYRVNGISSWPGYTFTSHVNVSGWWDTRDVRMVFELNGNNGPSGYPNNAISIGHIGIMGGYSSFNRVFDWDGNRNITLFGNLTLPGNVSATGTVSGSSFSGAGTNLTGTANSLNVGGYSARWATGRTIALTGDVTGTSGAFDGTAALSFGVTIANSAVTYAKIQNVATASVLGNSSASVAQAPAALSMATLAGMLSNQTMNINGSSASCTGNAATATKSNSIAYPFLNTSLDLNTSGGSNELIAFNSYYPSGGAYNQPIAGAQHFRILQFGRYDSADSNFWRGQMAMSFYEDRMWFRRENALTWQSWREFIHSGNVGSYALPITGGTVTGNSGVLLASTNDARFNIQTGTAGAWLDIRSETLGYAAVNLYGSTVATGRWSAGMTGGNSNYRITSGAQGAGTVFMEMNSSTNATNFPNALQQGGNQVVHSGNVASYALPIGGGTVTGQVLIGSYMSLNSSASIMGMVGFNRNAATGAIFNASYGAYQLHNNTGTLELQVYNSAGGFVGAHTFNNSGNVAFLTGTVTAGGNQVVHAGNVSTYALPIGGGTLNGNLTMGSGYQHRASDGSASAPGYSFSAETSTGIYRSGTNTLAFSTGGSQRVTINGVGAMNVTGAITQAGNQVLHAGNYNSYAVDNTKRVKQFFWDSLGASTTQARRFEIARIAIDIVNWNQVGTFEIELHEQYYSKGIKKRYAVRYGYSGTRPGLTLVEMTGAGDNNFQVVLGSEQLVSGNHYYLPIYVDVRYYSFVDVRVTTSRQITTNSTPPVGYTYINSSPTPTNITDFTADSTVDISNAATAWQAGGNVILHAGNYTSYPDATKLPLTGGTLTGRLTARYTDGTSGWDSIQIDAAPTSGGAYIRANRATAGTGEVGYAWATGGVNKWINYLNVNSDTLGWYQGSATVMTLTTGGALAIGGAFTAASAAITGAITQNGNQVLHAGNYNSYTMMSRGNVDNFDFNTYGNYNMNMVSGYIASSPNKPTAYAYDYGTVISFSMTGSPGQAQFYVSHAGNDLCFRGGWNGSSWQTWNRCLTDQNYYSYAFGLSTNNAVSGSNTYTNTNLFKSAVGSTVYLGSANTPPLQAYSNDGGPAFMSFHRGGSYAVNMGLDPDNVLRIGGWSASANRWQLDMSGNNTIPGTMTAASFSGAGTGLTGTASSLTAGSANAIADGAVSTTAKIANSVVTYAKIQNVAVSTVLGNSSASVAQAPQALSMATLAGMLSNQAMNINGSSASCTGNAATATNGFTVKPGWAGNQNLIASLANFNNSVPSGFYEYSGATNSPSATWYNLINVRHSNTGNDHGFQLAMSYYDEILWSRTYQGGTGANNGTFTAWRAHLHSGNFSSYALPLTGGTLTGALTATSFSGAGTGLTGTAASLSIGGSAGSVAASGITGQTGMWTSAARPGPYRLYRRDVNDAYSVQNYWTGTYWRLDGYYSNDTVHAGCSVAYADTAGSVSTIADGAVSTTAKLANSVVTYAKIQNVGSSSVLGNTSASVSQAPQEITFSNLGAYINGVARAWVTFNENPSTGAITINASLGISSVTRINYGQYRVNFSTAFADANYAVSGTIGYESNGGYLYGGFLNIPRVATPKTTTYCEVTASYGDGNTYNARFVHVVFDR